MLSEERRAFQATLGGLRRLLSRRSAAAAGHEAAVRGRDASDAEVREGSRVLELEARCDALEAAVEARRAEAVEAGVLGDCRRLT
mmetsp:Transcript_19976/g.59519  ORF Transcript_19976/g.59519 Transcript_19976/m.59519 type:complete len:85 (-) Transcript_19976:567-821(-)